MMQKEVAERIASPAGKKTYGILSVLLQAFFDVEVLFHVKPGSFFPPPKVDSSVLRLTRNSTLSAAASHFIEHVHQQAKQLRFLL